MKYSNESRKDQLRWIAQDAANFLENELRHSIDFPDPHESSWGWVYHLSDFPVVNGRIDLSAGFNLDPGVTLIAHRVVDEDGPGVVVEASDGDTTGIEWVRPHMFEEIINALEAL